MSARAAAAPHARTGAQLSYSALSELLVPSQGALFGIYADRRDGRTHAQEMAYLEGLVGRTFDVDKMYYRWEKVWPSPHESAAVAKGRIPLVNWVSVRTDGTVTRWADIAAGRHDADITARADAVKSFGHKLFVVFHHEPEDDSKFGTAAEYRAAWRRIVSIFRNRGATNAVWTLNLMAYTFNPASKRNPLDWYPGDDVVDWIGANGYNWYGSTHITNSPWRSFAEIFTRFYEWGKVRGKPLAVLETGVIEDPANPQRKATWFKDAAATMKGWPQLKLVTYYNAREWFIDTSQASTTGYRAWGLDPHLNPQTAPPPPDADTTPPLAAITGPVAGSSVSGLAEVTASASDDHGVARVELLVDGTVKATDSAAPFGFEWDAGFTPRQVTLQARAVDAAGNAGLSAPVTVNVTGDAEKPVVALTSPVGGSTVTYRSTVSIAATASDNIGVERVEIWVNGTLRCSDSAAPYTCDWVVWTRSGIRNTVRATAYDADGNAASSIVYITTA